MDDRALLLLDPLNKLEPLHALLARQGWRPTFASAGRSTSRPYIGLAALDETTLSKYGDLVEAALRRSVDTEWIGLLPSAHYINTFRQGLISDYLFDYHTAPPDRRRLLDSLGHAYGMSRIRRHAADHTHHPRGLSESALHVIKRHDRPGNVQELSMRVRLALTTRNARHISADHLGLDRRTFPRIPKRLETIRSEAERRAVYESLQRNRRNVTAAARELGISRVTLYRLMNKYGLVGRTARKNQAAPS